MTDPPDPLGALFRARHEIEQAVAAEDATVLAALARRDLFEASLGKLNEMIAQFGADPAVEPDSRADLQFVTPDGVRVIVEAKSFDTSTANTRDAIQHVLASEDREFEAHEIVDAVVKLGIDSQPASIRSLLSKMAESGQVDRPRRGSYQLAKSSQARKSYRVVRAPTPEEFMEMAGDERGPDYHPAEFDEPVHDLFARLPVAVEQDEPATQHDREETSS